MLNGNYSYTYITIYNCVITVAYQQFTEKRNNQITQDIDRRNKSAYMYKEFNPYFEHNYESDSQVI